MSKHALGTELLRGKAASRNVGTAYDAPHWEQPSRIKRSPALRSSPSIYLKARSSFCRNSAATKREYFPPRSCLSDLSHKAPFDLTWCIWIGDDPHHWPKRTCVGAMEPDLVAKRVRHAPAVMVMCKAESGLRRRA